MKWEFNESGTVSQIDIKFSELKGIPLNIRRGIFTMLDEFEDKEQHIVLNTNGEIQEGRASVVVNISVGE